MVFCHCQKSFKHHAQGIYDFLKSDGDAASWLGHVFESNMHRVFGAGLGPSALRCCDNDSLVLFPGTSGDSIVFRKLDDLSSLLRTGKGQPIDPDRARTYFQLTTRNCAVIDSFTFGIYATGKMLLFLFQRTVSRIHPIKVRPRGLQNFYNALPQELRLAEIYLVFVVRKDLCADYTVQAL